MEPEPQEDVGPTGDNTFIQELKIMGHKIEAELGKEVEQIWSERYNLEFESVIIEENPRKKKYGARCIFSLMDKEQRVASCSAYYEDENGNTSSIISDVQGAPSVRTSGWFVLLSQVRLGILSNIENITLDNDTDDPQRAARGIYYLFQFENSDDQPEMILKKKAGDMWPNELKRLKEKAGLDQQGRMVQEKKDATKKLKKSKKPEKRKRSKKRKKSKKRKRRPKKRRSKKKKRSK